MTTFQLKSKLTFGKYKGHLVEEIIDDDPGYLEWCLDEIDWFELDSEANQALTDSLNDEHYDYAEEMI